MRLRRIQPSRWWYRPLVYSLVALLLSGSGYGIQIILGKSNNALSNAISRKAEADAFFVATKSYRDLQALIAEAKTLGIDTTEEDALLAKMLLSLSSGSVDGIQSEATVSVSTIRAKIAEVKAAQLATEEEAKKYGTLALTITNGSGATVDAYLGDIKVTFTANDQGVVEGKLLVGTQELIISKTGYTNTSLKVDITSLATTTATATLTAKVTVSATPKPTATPKATAVPATSSTAFSTYKRTTVSSSRGSYTADIMEFELGAGKVKVYTDTALDNDCTNDCPGIPLKSYTQRYSNVVGAINGTYFCPYDYASCAGQTGSFFWKVQVPRLGKLINGTNGMGENDGYMTFNSSGNGTFYSSWISAPSVYAGINHHPTLVKNGAYVVDESKLDDKQRTTKGARGAIGLRGQTAVAVIVQSATIMDLGAVMVALGVDSALNLDGGGSSAMWYAGSYRRGPGRNLPNAIVFVEQ